MHDKRVALFALLCALSLYGQSTAGRLAGKATDPSGAPVPAGRVTAVNSETGQMIVETTNAEGNLVLHPLTPGNYNFSAQKDGFATLTLDGVTIDVAQSISTK